MQNKPSKAGILKKITVVLLLLTIVFTSIPQTPVSAAQQSKKTTTTSNKKTSKKVNKKFSLKTSKVKLQVGKTYAVKKAYKDPIISKDVSLKGYKASYKSSNTKVATVSSKGVIKAKKKGTATITVYFKKGNTTYYSKLKVQVISKKSSKNNNSNEPTQDDYGPDPGDFSEDIQ